jgi:hypothetical protein
VVPNEAINQGMPLLLLAMVIAIAIAIAAIAAAITVAAVAAVAIACPTPEALPLWPPVEVVLLPSMSADSSPVKRWMMRFCC